VLAVVVVGNFAAPSLHLCQRVVGLRKKKKKKKLKRSFFFFFLTGVITQVIRASRPTPPPLSFELEEVQHVERRDMKNSDKIVR